MGANQSGRTRTVSMENDTPVGVIDVSDAVVQRLKSGMSKAQAAKRAEEEEHQHQQQQQHHHHNRDPIDGSKQNVPSSYSNPAPYPPPGIIYAEPTITSIDVRRQKEAELQQNDVYWRKRLAQLEQTMNKTNTIMEKEYSAAVEDVRKRFQSAPPIHQLPPCQDLKAQLIACYRTHPGEPLRCSEEANAFINCVSVNRVKQLDNPATEGIKKPK